MDFFGGIANVLSGNIYNGCRLFEKWKLVINENPFVNHSPTRDWSSVHIQLCRTTYTLFQTVEENLERTRQKSIKEILIEKSHQRAPKYIFHTYIFCVANKHALSFT
jgi:hypothetical protein